MPDVPSWNEGRWDLTIIGGILCPGVTEVDVEVESDIDRQKSKGKQKTRTRDQGDKPRQLTITVTINDDPDERAQLALLIQVLDPVASDGVRDPLKIQNANAAIWKIEAINVLKISLPQPRDGGFLVLTVGAEEWSPDTAQKDVAQAKQKPKDDPTNWQPYVDDDLAGPGVPSEAGEEEGLGLT